MEIKRSHQYFTRYLKEGEEIIKVMREYIFSHVLAIIGSIIFILLPFFLIFPLFHRGTWGVLIFFVLLIFGLLFAFRLAYLLYFNTFVLTNQRIIDFDQKGFFDKTISETTYDKIQDVSIKKKGFFSTLFNYGMLVIQTAGSKNNLEMKNVYEPEKIQELITNIQKQIVNRKFEQKEDLTAKELVTILEEAKKNMGQARFQSFIKSYDSPAESTENNPTKKDAKNK